MTDATDINSTLQNIARQLGITANVLNNAAPAQSTTVSPVSYGFTLSTSIVTLIGTSALRHGLIFHNPNDNISCFVFPTLNTAVTTTVQGGSFRIFPGATLELPSTQYPNLNCGWSGWALSPSAGFTIWEFF